jgi:fibronectin-binding autotransporter adhesin
VNQSFKALLVSVCLMALPCAAQRPITQVPSKVILRPSDGTHNAEFGWSSAIDSSGDTIIVGARGQNTLEGEVYVFVKPASGWANATETTRLTIPGLAADSEFGYAVAISSDGNTIVASSPYSGSVVGAVYVFSPTNGSWSNGGTMVAELSASDGTAGNGLGTSVAISGSGATETVVAGAAWAPPSDQGAVYVFAEPAGGWTSTTQTAKLTVSNPVNNQTLGNAVAISGNTIAAGASGNGVYGPGAVYVFTKPRAGWANGTQNAELLASDGQAQDALGFSVAISGNKIVAGGPYHEVAAFDQGALYVFVEPASGWADAFQAAELTASSGNADSWLGQSVAISGSFIVGAAPGQRVGTSRYTGEVDAYEKPATGWANGTETYDLIAESGTPGGVGSAASLTSTGPIAISGDIGIDSMGAVFLFEK